MTAVSDSLQRKTKKSPGISTKFVWCFSPKPTSTGWGNATETRNYFRYYKPAILSHLGPATDTVTHTHIQLKSASALMPPGAVQEERHASSSTFVTQEAVEGNTQPAGAPPSCSPLKQIITPLRLQQFAEELKFHTDPNWVKEILKGIDKGVSLGYHGLRCQRISRNLASASQHPQIIDEELSKEVRARRIVGPFDTPPIPNLQCSGVGVIPKKTGGWRMIMHLSAPPDSSINDGIEFTLRYATIDDAVQMINYIYFLSYVFLMSV